MTGPRAVVRITITETDLDCGLLTTRALRHIRALLCDAPSRAVVHVDLGPLGMADDLLIDELAASPCARNMVIESTNWRTAQRAALALLGQLNPNDIHPGTAALRGEVAR